jgi:hypothetical protein
VLDGINNRGINFTVKIKVMYVAMSDFVITV